MGHILSTGWTLEQSDALRGFVASGLSYAQSAAKINAQFGTSYSRNSAIGRANRIGLACPKRPKLALKPRVHKPRIRIIASNGNSNGQRIVQVSETEQFKCRSADVVPLHLTLMQLTEKTCHWPYGEDPAAMTFCGAEVETDRPYCSPHCGIAYVPPKKREGYAIKFPINMSARSSFRGRTFAA